MLRKIKYAMKFLIVIKFEQKKIQFFFKMPNYNDNNKANVCNPNCPAAGPGRPAGFRGNTPAANNHGQQLNPNNPRYQERR